MRVSLQPAYLLHRRPYLDNSQLLELWCLDHGRTGAVARGARRSHRGGSTALVLQPFRPLLVSFSGRHELKTLTAVEPAAALAPLLGEALLSGFYLNELLMRLLQRAEPQPDLFGAYASALAGLAEGAALAPCLRRFEFALLEALGYGLALSQTAEGAPVLTGRDYVFDPADGLYPAPPLSHRQQTHVPGAHLLALAAGQFDGEVATSARLLTRAALAALLGPQPLHSRALLQRHRAGAGNVT